MKTITFYAYKGGTGRSLVVANAAKYLARFGQNVFVVDFDLEAPGLHYKLSDTIKPLVAKRGVVDYFNHYRQTGTLPDTLEVYQIPVPMPPGTHGSIRLMPAGAAPSAAYWRTLAGLNWHDLFYQPAGKGVAVFLELKEQIRQQFAPHFLLMDARTGITEVGGMVTTVLPDVVVCLVLNNRENLEGARAVLRSIRRAARAPGSEPIQIVPVLTRLPHCEHTDEDRQVAAEVRQYLTEVAPQLEDTLVLADDLILHSAPSLQVRERLLIGGIDTADQSRLLRDYLALFERFYFKPSAIDAYVQRLAADTAYLTLLGLQVGLPIAEAYIPLRAKLALPEDQDEYATFIGIRGEPDGNVEVGEIFKAAQPHGRGVVLLGEPGCGKTTATRRMAWCLASGHKPPESLGLPPEITPVYLRFRNLRGAILEQAGGLRMFLEQETRSRQADGFGEPGGDLWNGHGGPLLWILDGLDEVAEPGARKTVSGWVQEALAQRPDDRFLVTCRFQGYYGEGVPLGPDFLEFHVLALDEAQIERFVRGWCDAAHRKFQATGAGDAARAAKQSENDSQQLLQVVTGPAYQVGHIRELCTNPLLLTILCIVFHEERKLPTGRAELYAHCVRVLLEYWRRDLYRSDLGTLRESYDAEAARTVLARVAWWMHQEQDRTSALLSELAAEAAKGLRELSPSSGLEADGRKFLERMRDEAGILAMTGEDRCGFLHLSFQEYLAAEHAAGENYAAELASRAPDSWWREVALLSLRRSRPFCEAFFRHLLAEGIAEDHPELAERCLQETLYFTPAPFVRVLQSAESPRRQAAVLRLLRDRADHVPELESLCRGLAITPPATDEAREIRRFAREILVRRGIPWETTDDEEGVLVDERTSITFVWIPAGQFAMGSERGSSWTKPIHRVRISRGYWLAKYPVTNAQYARFLQAVGSGANKPAFWHNRRLNQPEQPVVGVSWDEARVFCDWAMSRLPTEAEWEYACRAGTTTEYSFGGDAGQLGEYGWFKDNSGGQTQPVGAKTPNPWGLHDMHGNVWEWCQDWFSANYYAHSPEVDPTGPDSADHRLNRGGSWATSPRNCGSPSRAKSQPASRIAGLGFRPARDRTV